MVGKAVDPEEKECENLLRDGDPRAVPRLMSRYQRPLLSFLFHRIGDRAAAEDLLQEVFLRVWKNRAAFRAEGRLAGWLFTIARRLGIDHLKARARRADVPLEDLVGGESPPETILAGLEDRARIEAAIADLPDAQREVFLLREYGGMSFAEIARETGCPLGTALARMRYAVLKLRKDLGGAHA